MKKIAVIGGGPAGMIAAYAAAQTDKSSEVTLIEKNEKLGKKLFITGKGRCNVTNASDIETMMNNVVSNRDFLYSAFYTFDNEALMSLIEANGTKLKTERGNRVFPVSDHSSDIIKALKNALDKAGVKVLLNTTVDDIETEDGVAKGLWITDSKNKRRFEDFDCIIVATGGLSYPVTGSDGDGFRFADKVGHTKKECVPALVPIETEEEYVKDMQGLSLKNVEVTIKDGKKTLYSDFGEMLFTHFGVSGPLILSASSVVGRTLKKKNLQMYIDLKPAVSEDTLDKRFLNIIEENKNKQLKNSLNGLLPGKMLAVYMNLLGIDTEKQMNSVTKEERKKMISLLKAFPLTLVSLRGFNEAIITSGGISVKEVNPSTMESKLVKNLYFAGEMLDLDAFTGGFNLQIAWSTGYLAGISAAE
ncbi:MAG: NAD(P)/FAD-dependent oxidoreductase [Lachnospiraceae bacterium]|nr:NAD(P)/FAD-dependent oxidoreductase [Lachnospiraceae bacterium]